MVHLPGIKAALRKSPGSHFARLAQELPAAASNLASDMSIMLHTTSRRLTEPAETPAEYALQLALLSTLQVWACFTHAACTRLLAFGMQMLCHRGASSTMMARFIPCSRTQHSNACQVPVLAGSIIAFSQVVCSSPTAAINRSGRSSCKPSARIWML